MLRLEYIVAANHARHQELFHKTSVGLPTTKATRNITFKIPWNLLELGRGEAADTLIPQRRVTSLKVPVFARTVFCFISFSFFVFMRFKP